MKKGDRLSDATVRWAKKALLAGSSPRAVARHLGCGLITVIRMRDGDTYAGVRVEGEEALRPQVEVVDGPPPELALRKDGAELVLPELSEERQREMERELERVFGIRASGGTPEPVDPVQAEADRMLGRR